MYWLLDVWIDGYMDRWVSEWLDVWIYGLFGLQKVLNIQKPIHPTNPTTVRIQ
jgi:hypothetical protein